MNLSNSIVVFWNLLEFKYSTDKKRSDAINQIDSTAKINTFMISQIPILHDAMSEIHKDLSTSYFLANEAQSLASEIKSHASQARFIKAKLNNLETNIYTDKIKFLTLRARNCFSNASDNAIKAEILVARTKASATYTAIRTKATEKAIRAVTKAAMSKSHADEIFANALFSMANSKKNTIVNIIAKSIVVSIAFTYASINSNKADAAIKYSKLVAINTSFGKLAEHLIACSNEQFYIKKRAWDLSLITSMVQGLSEVFPEEWDEWQHWISDMMELRTRMQSKGMNHRLVSLITFYRLFRFALHIGIDKVFILATRRATR